MSPTFLVNEEESWLPQGWIFRGLLSRVITNLSDKDPDLARSIEGSITESFDEESYAAQTLNEAATRGEFSPAFGSVRLLDKEHFNLFLQATQQTVKAVIRAGPASFSRSSDYLVFLTSISVLEALLRLDRRSIEPKETPGRLIIRRELTWEAPVWAYDLALEHFIASLQMDAVQGELLNTLVECRMSDDLLAFIRFHAGMRLTPVQVRFSEIEQ